MPRPRKPVSEEQLAANRANATQSTGPRTPEGKARSAQNARKHGFTAAVFAVVRLEDLDEVAHLKTDLVAVYQPINAQELFAIERIALAQQSVLRAARLEAGLFTTCLNEVLDSSGQPFFPMSPELVGDGDIQTTRAQNRNYALAEGFQRMAKTANTWSLFLRYQAQSERLYRRAVEDLERLQALRPNLPNEPVSPGLPEPNETVSPPDETNPSLPQVLPNHEAVPAASLQTPCRNGTPHAKLLSERSPASPPARRPNRALKPPGLFRLACAVAPRTSKCPRHHLLYNEVRGKRSDTEARRRPAERCPA